MHPMESKDIAVNHVRGKVVRIRPRMDTQRKDVKKFSNPIKSAVACEDLQEHLA